MEKIDFQGSIFHFIATKNKYVDIQALDLALFVSDPPLRSNQTVVSLTSCSLIPAEYLLFLSESERDEE